LVEGQGREETHTKAQLTNVFYCVPPSSINEKIVATTSLGVKERTKILMAQKDRWITEYKKSLDEWNERRKVQAEDYDLTSTLSPLQSRMEALRQKGLLLK
jgi:hypothetical protein